MIFKNLIRYDSQGLIPDYLVEDHKKGGRGGFRTGGGAKIPPNPPLPKGGTERLLPNDQSQKLKNCRSSAQSHGPRRAERPAAAPHVS